MKLICTICGRPIKEVQRNLSGELTEYPYLCKKCAKVEEVLLFDEARFNCLAVPIETYREICRKLAKGINKEYDYAFGKTNAKLPNVPSSRVLEIKSYPMELFLKVYRDDYIEGISAMHIKHLENELEETEAEIEDLQSHAGDLERRIEHYPMVKVKRERDYISKGKKRL